MKIEEARMIISTAVVVRHNSVVDDGTEDLMYAYSAIIADLERQNNELKSDYADKIRAFTSVIIERDEARADAVDYAEEYRDAHAGQKTHNAELKYNEAVATLRKYGADK